MMRKEIIFAIVAGSLLGLVVAFGIWKANEALKPSKEETAAEVTTPSEPTSSLEITLSQPTDEEVMTSSPVVLNGLTQPGSWVVISTDEEDYLLQADEQGVFEEKAALAGGLNEILISAFNTEGDATEKTLFLVYSSEFAKKIEDEEKTGRGYIGTVTDITESTLQIKNSSGEIQMVSVNEEETDFVKTIKTSQVIKLEDVAIGDFVVAMGLKNGNGVLNGKRILVTTPFESAGRKALLGEVAKIEKKVISLKVGDKTWEVTFAKTWEGPEISEVEEGMKIIVVGTAKENALEETRFLHLVEQD